MTVGGAATTRRNHCVEASARARPQSDRHERSISTNRTQPKLAP